MKFKGPLDNVRHTNILIIRIPEEEKEQEIENQSEEITTENFPNLVKELAIQTKEAQSPKQDDFRVAHPKIHHN